MDASYRNLDYPMEPIRQGKKVYVKSCDEDLPGMNTTTRYTIVKSSSDLLPLPFLTAKGIQAHCSGDPCVAASAKRTGVTTLSPAGRVVTLVPIS